MDTTEPITPTAASGPPTLGDMVAEIVPPSDPGFDRLRFVTAATEGPS